VFQDCVRVNVREKEDVLKFVRTFLTDSRFFSGVGRAVAPKLAPAGDEVRRAGTELHETLVSLLPKSEVAEWSAQPLIRLQLSVDIVDKLAAEPAVSAGPSIEVADVTVVSFLDQQAKQIFGIAELAPGTKLSGLGLRWAEASAGASLEWVKDIVSQLRRAARGEIPTIRWGYLHEIGGTARYAPLLSRVRRLPTMQCQQFDVNLVPYDELAATRVVARMIPLSDIVCHRIDQMQLSTLKVRDLARRFKTERLSRMPFLTDSNRITMIVHRSMVDHYLASKLIDDESANVSNLSVAEMLQHDAELKRLFETSFQVIAQTARLSDVNGVLAANHEIQDVFVTATGNRDEPVMGWITNAMLAQHAV
jgi:hypothetical protein